jgi:hypothetical protein
MDEDLQVRMALKRRRQGIAARDYEGLQALAPHGKDYPLSGVSGLIINHGFRHRSVSSRIAIVSSVTVIAESISPDGL